MSEPIDEVAAALDPGGDEEHIQRVAIIDDDPERAKRIAQALALVHSWPGVSWAG
jgi:hypothetical protein